MQEAPQLCPHFHRAVELIGRRWTGAIVFVLLQRPERFSAIRAAVPDITDRMLSERLRELEQECIVRRTAVAGAPQRVEYSLTDRGRALAGAVSAIAAWSHEWLTDCRECPPDCGPAPVRT